MTLPGGSGIEALVERAGVGGENSLVLSPGGLEVAVRKGPVSALPLRKEKVPDASAVTVPS